MAYKKLVSNLQWGYVHQKYKPRQLSSSNQVIKNKPNNQLKDPTSNFYYQNFKTKRWWREKSADQKLPMEIRNKLQIINQIREKKKVCLSADNSQVKKVHYKWLALLQIFSSTCIQYIIKLLHLTCFKRMPLLTGTSVGSWKLARKQTLSLYQMGEIQKFQEAGRIYSSSPQQKSFSKKSTQKVHKIRM